MITPEVLVPVLGMGVLSMYWLILGKWMGGTLRTYMDHPFWFGLDKTTIGVITVLQVFAIVGFLVGWVSWVRKKPSRGLFFKYSPNLLSYTYTMFLLSAIAWPIATYYNRPFAAVLSTVLTAVSSVLLLAGAVEDRPTRWWVTIGWASLAMVTVLCDGVIWNANYILYRDVVDSVTHPTAYPLFA